MYLNKILSLSMALTLAFGAMGQSRSLDPTGKNDRSGMIETIVGQDPSKIETVMTPPFKDGQMISCGPELLMVSNMFRNAQGSYYGYDTLSVSYIDQENFLPDDSRYRFELVDTVSTYDRCMMSLTRSIGEGEQEMVLISQYSSMLRLDGFKGEFEKTSSAPSTVGSWIPMIPIHMFGWDYWMAGFMNSNWNTPGYQYDLDDCDNICSGYYANKVRQNEAWQALVSAQAVDLKDDKRQGVLFFANNCIYSFGGDLNLTSKTELPEIRNGLDLIIVKNKLLVEPNTWGSTKGDFDDDGEDDILAICHTAGNKFYLVFLPKCSPANAKVVLISEGEESWKDPSIHYYCTVDIADIYPHGEKAQEHNFIIAWWNHYRNYKYDTSLDHHWRRSNIAKYTEVPVKEVMGWINGSEVNNPIKYHEQRIEYYFNKRTFQQHEGSLFRSPNLTVFYPRGRDHEAAFSAFDYIFNTMQVKDPEAGNLYLCDLSSVIYYDKDYQFDYDANEAMWRASTVYKGRFAGRPVVLKYAFDSKGYMHPGETLVVPVVVRDTKRRSKYHERLGLGDYTTDIVLYGASSTPDRVYYWTNPAYSHPEYGDKYYDYGIDVLRKFHATYVRWHKPFVMGMVSKPKVEVELVESFFTATNPVIKTAIAIPPYDADIDRENTHGYGVGIAGINMEHETGKSEGTTVSSGTSWSAGGEFTLFELVKLGGEYERDESFSKSTEREISTTKSHGYTMTEEQDAIIFQYLPVDVFRYRAVSCKARPELVGKDMIYYITRGNDIVETMCTVDEYNELISGTGAMQFDQALFPHKVGDLNNYRRCSSTSTDEYIRSLFPVKKGGMFILGDIVSSSSGGETGAALSISESTSQGTSHTVSTSAKATFGLEWPVFSASTELAITSEEEYSITNTWGKSVEFSGSVPTAPMGQMYKFRQVWYEYQNPEGDQNFLVGDWILVDYINREKPVSVNLDLQDNCFVKWDDGNYYSAAVLNWNIKNNKGVEIDRIELYYRLDGLTPRRPCVKDDPLCKVTLDNAVDDWVLIDKSFDIEEDEDGNWHGVWNDFQYALDDETDTWYTLDWFSMTPEQYLSIIEANDYRKSQVHYKVKVYFVDGTEVEGENTARSRADDKEIEIYESPIASMTIYEGENGQTGLEDVEISHDQLLNSPIFGGKLPDGRAYNLLGIPVDENYKGVVIQNGKKILRK